jgi:hypothetical protein
MPALCSPSARGLASVLPADCLVDRHRVCVEEALSVAAADLKQHVSACDVLHAFGDLVQSQLGTEGGQACNKIRLRSDVMSVRNSWSILTMSMPGWRR